MNEDAASQRVRADLGRWGVHLDLAGCTPVSDTPIVVQEVRRSMQGKATHKFSWECLRCGGWLPSFKPVTRQVVEQAQSALPGTSVFFFDRVSRGTLELASLASDSGALVFFEPSGRGDQRLFAEALELSHVVKYSNQRISDLADESPADNRMLEVQTLGMHGLRYRTPHRKRHDGWRALEAVPAARTVDSCGSGDWCTAGMIATMAAGGRATFESSTLTEIKDGLVYGQELAAWNCAFEGARGGMYSSLAANAPLMTRVRKTALANRAFEKREAPLSLLHCPKCDVA
ncbi:carbohydrate kinase [Mycobacterium sp. 1164966.3]|uniref:carbohydrate kinase n=1 Tax=Mycobacterium sp. 1164966.3 TaxID=1856861 RepID=UPI00155FD8FB|nr:carbohydrate kinase [Mycobacterium sp. 1164966.3]